MSYLIGRVFVDAAGYTYREHRPGWFRRTTAPLSPHTEHPIEPAMMRYLTEPGTFVIEEEP